MLTNLPSCVCSYEAVWQSIHAKHHDISLKAKVDRAMPLA